MRELKEFKYEEVELPNGDIVETVTFGPLVQVKSIPEAPEYDHFTLYVNNVQVSFPFKLLARYQVVMDDIIEQCDYFLPHIEKKQWMKVLLSLLMGRKKVRVKYVFESFDKDNDNGN